MTSAADQAVLAIQARVWAGVCQQVDGLALVGPVAALHRHGVIARLVQGAVSPSDAGGNAGHVAVALKFLANIGLAETPAPLRADSPVQLTDAGQAWAPLAPCYAAAPALIAAARAIFAGGDIDDDVASLAEADFGLEPAADPAWRERAFHHLAGTLAGPLLLAQADTGRLPPFAVAPLACDEAPWPPVAARAARHLFGRLGWLDQGQWTIAGRIALAFAGQYRYPVSYLPSLAAADDLMFGDAGALRRRDDAGTETHVDREADIRFSGEVFNRSCARPLFELALPLFDTADIAAQPRAIVDVGCGDATLLIELYRAIAGRTARGKALADHPLVLVGGEYNPAARAVAARRLAAAGLPHRTCFADIGDPDALMVALVEAGIDPADCLFVTKSVIHNRSLRATAPDRSPLPARSGPFVAPDGSLVDPDIVLADLVDCLRRWRPHLARHGLIAIEAHATPGPAIVAAQGRSPAASLEAVHGLSCQYLVLADEFHAAARAAGLVARAGSAFGAAAVGHDFLSFDHFLSATA